MANDLIFSQGQGEKDLFWQAKLSLCRTQKVNRNTTTESKICPNHIQISDITLKEYHKAEENGEHHSKQAAVWWSLGNFHLPQCLPSLHPCTLQHGKFSNLSDQLLVCSIQWWAFGRSRRFRWFFITRLFTLLLHCFLIHRVHSFFLHQILINKHLHILLRNHAWIWPIWTQTHTIFTFDRSIFTSSSSTNLKINYEISIFRSYLIHYKPICFASTFTLQTPNPQFFPTDLNLWDQPITQVMPLYKNKSYNEEKGNTRKL